jgi:CRP-like cAMP-binding protein
MIEPSTIGLFTGLEPSELRMIMAVATKRQFDASEVIIRHSEPGTRLFVIQTGNIDYQIVTGDGKSILLWRFVPGDVFGVAAFLSKPTGYLGTAKSVFRSEILIWEHKVVLQLAKTLPRLAENALRTALRYIALYTERHMRLVSGNAQERLAFALTSLGSRAGHALPTGLEIDIKNEDLASLADINFYTATRILKAWERKGAVEKSRGKVLIRCPEKLLAA